MKKDKEWLKQEIKKVSNDYPTYHDERDDLIKKMVNMHEVLELIDQLDEPKKLYTSVFATKGTEKGLFLYKEDGSIKVGDNMMVFDKSNQEYHLTEKEIKEHDERFWKFAEEVLDKA